MFFGWKKVPRRVVRKKRRVNRSYDLHKEAARARIHARLQYFNQYYQHSYNRVVIRDQRRCWGSCSSKGNLNFSYKLLFLQPCLRDYVIVHELSHLRVLNHSQEFWNVMGEVMPDYAERATALRTLERSVGTALRTLQRLPHDCSACLFCTADEAGVSVTEKESKVTLGLKDCALVGVLTA